jgi:hypothetical protein
MASYAYTFVSGDTVTPTKLNNARTVSNIANADVSATAAIAGSKIAPTFTSQVTVPNGSASAPGIRITGEQSGLFRSGSTTLGVAVDGSLSFNALKSDGVNYGGLISMSSPSGTLPASVNTNNNEGFIVLAGSNGPATGGQIRCYGISHATKPNHVELCNNTAARLTLDNNGNVGIGTASPNPAAKLDVASTTQGFLLPRMTTAQRDAISTPPAGLMIYNTSTNKLQVRTNTAWVDLH